MSRIRFLPAAAFVAAGALLWSGVARAGDEVPAPAAPAAKTAPVAEATPAATTAPATKTSSPICSMMGWVAKQVAPNVECGSAECEKAWGAWFAGGADVPLAGLRDTLVADGWTADRTLAFFKDMRAKMSAGGECSKGDCAKGGCAKGDCSKGDCAKGGAGADATAKADGGCCQGKGERTDGKPCCGGCKKSETAKTDEAAPTPAPAPAKP